MGLVSWILVGFVAGWLATYIAGGDRRRGCLSNIVLGIIGALVGGWLMNFLGRVGPTGFNLWSVGVAVLGAVIVLTVRQLVFGKHRR